MSLFLNSVLNNSDLMISVGYADKPTSKSRNELYINSKYNYDLNAYNKSLVIDKVRWEVGLNASAYPSVNSVYVVDGVRVYVCVSNNGGGASIEKPTSRAIFNVKMSDGYVWRYLFDLEIDDLVNHIRLPHTSTSFTMQGVIASVAGIDETIVYDTKPVIKVLSDDGSNALFDFDYTNNSVSNITVTSGGNGYHEGDLLTISDNYVGSGCNIDVNVVDGVVVVNSFTPGGNYTTAKAFVVGDGVGALIELSVTDGSISSVDLVSGGSGYTWVKVVVLPSENSDCKMITLEPSNGFGYRFQDETQAKLLISKSIDVDVDDDPINYIILSSKSHTKEIPIIYQVNIINTRLLAIDSDNLIHLILNL